MVEACIQHNVETFRHPIYPFLYIIDDPLLANDILSSLPQSFGMEVGFGLEPTSVFHIDATIPWILAERDDFRFRIFKNDTRQRWIDVKSDTEQIHQPIIALHLDASAAMQKQAQTLVYRNINYQEMDMIACTELKKNQRLVFIVDGDHVPEVPMYGSFLQKHGYDASQLKRRSSDVSQFTFPYPFYPNDYVLDVTK